MKTVVTDLDGTLLNKGELSQTTIEILEEFQKENRLILATGRTIESAKGIYQALKMDEYHNGALILVNGLAYYDFKDQEYRCLEMLDLKNVKRIVRIANCLFFRMTIVGTNERCQLNSLYDRIFYLLRFIIKGKPMKKFEKPASYPKSIEKIGLEATIFFPFFYGLLKFFLKDYEVVQATRHWVEVMPKGTNKVNQIKYAVQKYQIDHEDLYVFGDGENDVEMLKYAKHSYTPANALKEAKQAASQECLSSEQDGVAMEIKWLLR